MSNDYVVAMLGNEDPPQIPEGTLSVFELSLDASSDIAGLTIAIQSLNAAVEEVRVDIYNSFTSRWDEEGVGNLFEVLGGVRQLRKIEFYGLRIFPYVMPITMAERTLARASTLQEFSLVGVNLSAPTPLEFRQFSTTLKQHPALKVFGLDNCRLRDERTGPTLDEAIVRSLVEIPSLERVVLRAMEVTMWSTLSCTSVALLCSSSTLKSLELFVFPSSSGSSFLKEMARSLIEHKKKSQLEDISISGCLGGVEGARLVSKMIQTNTKLKCLELHLRERSEKDDEAGIVDISKALAKNKTLEKFQLHGATNKAGSIETRKAYLDMLLANYTLLHSLQVFHPGFLRPDNEVYLKLNQVGRGRLLENFNVVSKMEWVDTIAQVADDIDCLYYLLHTNPLLCASCSSTEVRCETPDSLATPGPEMNRKRKRPEESCEAGLVTP